jgi:CHAD domain-containing protein
MTRRSLAHQVFRHQCGTLRKRLAVAASPDAAAREIKRARHAVRRTRELLVVLRRLLPDLRVRKLDRQLRRISRILGAIRETDVIRQLLESLGGHRGGALALAGRQNEQVRSWHVHHLGQLLSGRSRHRFEQAVEAVDRKLGATGEPRFGGATGKDAGSWDRAVRAHVVQRARRLQAACDAALPDRHPHGTRIDVKKLRLALELSEQGTVGGVDTLLARLRQVQGRLGAVRDRRVLVARLETVTWVSGARLDQGAELDAVILSLERECERLEAEYASLNREDVSAICSAVGRLFDGPPVASRVAVVRLADHRAARFGLREASPVSRRAAD